LGRKKLELVLQTILASTTACQIIVYLHLKTQTPHSVSIKKLQVVISR